IITNTSGGPTGDYKVIQHPDYTLEENHDAVNTSYPTYKYQRDGSTLGAEGKFIKVEIVQKSLSNSENYRFLKDEEVYRIGIEFYNNLGQVSLPKWIVDYKMPSGNLAGNFNTLKVELKPEFYSWLNSYPFE